MRVPRVRDVQVTDAGESPYAGIGYYGMTIAAERTVATDSQSDTQAGLAHVRCSFTVLGSL